MQLKRMGSQKILNFLFVCIKQICIERSHELHIRSAVNTAHVNQISTMLALALIDMQGCNHGLFFIVFVFVQFRQHNQGMGIGG